MGFESDVLGDSGCGHDLADGSQTADHTPGPDTGCVLVGRRIESIQCFLRQDGQNVGLGHEPVAAGGTT